MRAMDAPDTGRPFVMHHPTTVLLTYCFEFEAMGTMLIVWTIVINTRKPNVIYRPAYPSSNLGRVQNLPHHELIEPPPRKLGL